MADRDEIDIGIFVVNELREIFILMKKFLRNLEVQIEAYPSHTIVGSLIRSFAIKFVNAWRRPLENALLTLENTDHEILNRTFSSESGEIEKKLCKENLGVKNGISIVITLVDRLDEVLEFVQIISSAPATSDDDTVKDNLGRFGLWLCAQMKPFPKIIYPTILEQFSESSRGLNDLRPRGC